VNIEIHIAMSVATICMLYFTITMKEAWQVHDKLLCLCNMGAEKHWYVMCPQCPLPFLLFLITNVHYVTPLKMYTSCCHLSRASGTTVLSLSMSVCHEHLYSRTRIRSPRIRSLIFKVPKSYCF
jgi:hypothetical protein